MKIQNSKFKVQNCGRLLLLVLSLNTACCLLSTAAYASDKWPGVDESVVEKYAKEQGREAHEPLINTDQGDLLLFVFLLAGTVGGFVAGYSWRILMNEKSPATTRGEKTSMPTSPHSAE